MKNCNKDRLPYMSVCWCCILMVCLTTRSVFGENFGGPPELIKKRTPIYPPDDTGTRNVKACLTTSSVPGENFGGFNTAEMLKGMTKFERPYDPGTWNVKITGIDTRYKSPWQGTVIGTLSSKLLDSGILDRYPKLKILCQTGKGGATISDRWSEISAAVFGCKDKTYGKMCNDALGEYSSNLVAGESSALGADVGLLIASEWGLGAFATGAFATGGAALGVLALPYIVKMYKYNAGFDELEELEEKDKLYKDRAYLTLPDHFLSCDEMEASDKKIAKELADKYNIPEDRALKIVQRSNGSKGVAELTIEQDKEKFDKLFPSFNKEKEEAAFLKRMMDKEIRKQAHDKEMLKSAAQKAPTHNITNGQNNVIIFNDDEKLRTVEQKQTIDSALTVNKEPTVSVDKSNIFNNWWNEYFSDEENSENTEHEAKQNATTIKNDENTLANNNENEESEGAVADSKIGVDNSVSSEKSVGKSVRKEQKAENDDSWTKWFQGVVKDSAKTFSQNTVCTIGRDINENEQRKRNKKARQKQKIRDLNNRVTSKPEDPVTKKVETSTTKNQKKVTPVAKPTAVATKAPPKVKTTTSKPVCDHEFVSHQAYPGGPFSPLTCTKCGYVLGSPL